MSDVSASHCGENKLSFLSSVLESNSSVHSCSHCKDLVIDTVQNWNNPISVLLEYTDVSELLKAYRECFLIRLTLIPWVSDLSDLSDHAWPKRLRRLISRTKRRPTYQLYITFIWSYPKKPQSVLEAVVLHWLFKGESKDGRLFLVNVQSGKCADFISSSASTSTW
jgi:hypothetical protein